MQSTSVATLGGTCSILVGVLYMVVGAIYLNDPADEPVEAMIPLLHHKGISLTRMSDC